jgi:hypothetical protein
MKQKALGIAKTGKRPRSQSMELDELQLRTRKKAGFRVFILPSAPRVTARQIKEWLAGWP